ncbi:hypothetical protein ACP0HM_06845 [Escherichia coli]
MLWSRLNNWLMSFSLGIAIVEEQLQQLREQGLVMNLQQDIWVSDEVFRRLRLRSLQSRQRSDASRCSHDLCAIAAGTSGRITRHRW